MITLHQNSNQQARALVVLIAAIAAGLFVSSSIQAQEAKTTFDDHVKTILRQRCASCHGPDSKKGDLDISNYTNLMQGGSSGSVIEPGDPDGSYLYNLVTHEDEPVMPPGGKIPDAEIEVIRKWIELGALENQGSKAVMSKKPSAVAMGDNPLVRPEVVARFPRIPKEPVQHTDRNPVAMSIATSPWAPLVAVAGKNQVVLYDSTTLQLLGVLPFPEGNVNVVKFSRSGSVLLAAGGRAGNSGLVALWDVASGDRISTIGDELDEVLAADISPDHSMVALGGPGRVVRVYSTETGEVLQTIKKHTDWITSLAFSTDGVLLATGDRNGGLHVWESLTGRAYLTLKGHTASINDIAWRGDSNIVASASTDTTIRLWELNNGGQVKSWGAHGGGVNSIAFTRDGRILSAGVDKTSKLWGQDGAQAIAFPAFADLATAVAYCDETARAIAGDYTGEIRVWKSDDAAHIGNLSANPLTLATRVAQAQADFDSKNAQVAPLQVAAKTATDAAMAVQQQLDAAIATRNTNQTAFDQMQQAMAQVNEKASQLKSQLGQAQGNLTQLTEAKPLLEQSLTSMTEASTRIPADETLKQQVLQLQQRISALAASITETQTTVSTLQTSVTAADTEVQSTDAKLKTAEAALKTATDTVTTLTAQIGPLNQARDEANAKLKVATDAAAAAQSALANWQAEAQFHEQMKQLRAQLQDAENVVSERQQVLDSATAELQAAQAKSDQASQSVGEARQSVQQIQDAIQAAKGIQKQ